MPDLNTKLEARRSFRYNRRALAAGDSFDASEKDARLLTRIGHAQYATRVLTADTTGVAAEVSGVEPVRRRRGQSRNSDLPE